MKTETKTGAPRGVKSGAPKGVKTGMILGVAAAFALAFYLSPVEQEKGAHRDFTVVYRDSIAPVTTVPGTGVNTTADSLGHANGFSAYVTIRGDAFKFGTRSLAVTFSKLTDSARLQGALVRVNHVTGADDTVWYSVPWRTPISGINTAKGVAEVRDTTVISGYISSRGFNFGAGGVATPLDFSHYGFVAYRVVTGKSDSGKIYINYFLGS